MFGQRELRELEARCVQDDPPACTAACPAHVDVRAVLAEAGRGNWPAALAILKRALPFPGILGRVCPQPCRPACKRAEAGDPISIAALERACADLGGDTGPPKVLPRRGRRVAVVGAGLSGLTAAYDLARKGYGVIVYETGDRLGGSLWDLDEDRLPRSVLRAELAVVEQVGVEIRLRVGFGEAELAGLGTEFDAVYLATGASGDALGLARDERGTIRVDATTFATDRAGVFAGGGLLRGAAGRSPDGSGAACPPPRGFDGSGSARLPPRGDPELSPDLSPIVSVSDGRRAAISIDRYLQNVSLTAARTDTGSTTTQLHTSTDGVAPRSAVPMSRPDDGYLPEEAAEEARRCLQCECLECVKACLYLERYRRYPRRYVREIYNNLSIVTGERRANRFINSCSLCGLCAVICPTGLDMGEVAKKARQIMVEQRRMPPSAHDSALRDMTFSNSDACALARHRPGSTRSEYVFFPGCQLAASSPEHVERVYAYLRDRLGDVGLVLGCCGAPADWAGRPDLFDPTVASLGTTLASLGGSPADPRGRPGTADTPTVILACSSCHRVFRERLPQVKVASLWTILEEHGPPECPEANGCARTVAVHDPCGTRHEAAIQDSVRNILTGLGYEIEELPLNRERTECCGYGGEMWLANPDLAKAVVERRVAASGRDYVTYCAVCRDFFAARGKRTLHLLDLVFGQDPGGRATRRGPGHSDRHENRARLSRTMRRDLWGEDMDGPDGGAAARLVIAGDVKERLDERLILVEDVRRVIAYAERTGRRLWNRDTGRFLARYRPNVVTYWVEYTKLSPGAAPPPPAVPCDGEAFVVHNAYSHRMRVGEDVTS